MKKTKNAVRVQRRNDHKICPELRGAFFAAARMPRGWQIAGAVAGTVLVAGGVFALTQWIFTRKAAESVPVAEQHDDAPTFMHSLTGAPLAEQDGAHRVFAVMVENSADAWPLSGVEDAFLTIEAPAESDIPRFIAFYSDDQGEVKKIGPVRSARRYYLDWAAEFSPLYAHVGGSPEALAALPTLPTITNFDEFYNGSFFWRATDRYAPHNAYTSTDLLVKGAEAKQVVATHVAPWKFAAPVDLGESAVAMDVDWTTGTTYDFSWQMREDGQYVRTRNTLSLPVTSADGDPYVVANVVAMETEIAIVDAVGRKDIATLGEGAAKVMTAGRVIDARWKKASAEDRLRFFDALTGEEIAFTPGKTWIGVLPMGLASVQIRNAGDR